VAPCGVARDGHVRAAFTIPGMPTLVEVWDAAIAREPDDWSHAAVELVLDDPERMEEAALLLCAANPWHDETWRGGVLRFRVARTFGYGVSGQLARGLLRRLDKAAIGGRLRILSSLDAVLPVATQGPTF
jgi:hypothetical protein